MKPSRLLQSILFLLWEERLVQFLLRELDYIPRSPTAVESSLTKGALETCTNGLPGIDGSSEAGISVCCPINCGTCGGAGCSSSDRPDSDCCPNEIIDSDPGDCADTVAAPCVMTGEGTRSAAIDLKQAQRQLRQIVVLGGALTEVGVVGYETSRCRAELNLVEYEMQQW